MAEKNTKSAENKTEKSKNKKYHKTNKNGKASAVKKADTKAPKKQTKKATAEKPAKKTKAQDKSYKPAKRSSNKKTVKNVKPLRITPLGGLGEIGKNITLYEYDGDMFLVDCGMSFPDEEMPGIDIVIPDFSHVVQNIEKIKGLVVTHGHEDHIGAIPYLLKECNIPVYGTALTLGLIEGKLREHKVLDSAKLNVIKPGDTVKLGKFAVEFIHVNHSIPDAVALAITTPLGTVVQTGDFKIDTTPIDGEVIDLARFGELGKQGVLALLSDSTNAERAGFTPSESIVGESFANLFKKAENKRIIVATFSSNIHRVQQIIDEAVRCDRKVAVSGRSMQNVVQVASELGYLTVPEGVLIDIDMIKKYTPEQLVIITTGSQGEPMSALHRMAFGDHRKVSVGPGDFIIISATPIPGNEKTVTKVINELLKLGAFVVYEKMYDVHVSGHACQEELKIMLSLVKPKYFIPVHGEQKHLRKHAMLGEAMGVPVDHIIMPSNGMAVSLLSENSYAVSDVPAGNVFVDGYGVGDVGSLVLRERKLLSQDGVIVVSAVLDASTGYNLSEPEIHSRGFVFVKESTELFRGAQDVVIRILDKYADSKRRDINALKGKIKDEVLRYMYEKTKRSPVIIPVIQEI